MGQDTEDIVGVEDLCHGFDSDVSHSHFFFLHLTCELKADLVVTSCHCIVTQPLNYFSVWLKSLNRFSVYQINLFPTAAQGLGLVTTLAYSWVSDGLGGKRWQLLTIPAVCEHWIEHSTWYTDLLKVLNFVGMVIVASYPSYGVVFFGYMINAASWGFWPVLYVSLFHQSTSYIAKSGNIKELISHIPGLGQRILP